MIYIREINKLLKNNNFVSFLCKKNQYDLADKFEDLLFNNGYRWISSGYTKFIKGHIKSSIHITYDYYIIELNHPNCGNGIITVSSTNDKNLYDDTYEFNDYLVNNIFKESPSYKPKKIERTL